MTPSQAELLLHLAENRHAAGNDLINEMRRMGSTHAQYLLEEEQMLMKALEINRHDQQQFANYMPQRPQTLQGSRMAIAQSGGQNEAQTKETQQRPQRPASGQ